VEVTDLHLVQAILGGWADQPVLVLDCLSLWVSRQLPEQPRPDQAQALWEVLQPQLAAFEAEVRRRRATAIVVSNEVGWGVVPEHPSGRLFRDLLGWCNQWLAARADAVWLLVAGIPLCLKALERACGPDEAANAGR
jgi:adenosylcobinamide kinase/adenosylcobinamide-phosphate guanylyltransferase